MSLLKSMLKKKKDAGGVPFDPKTSASKKNPSSSGASFISRAATIQSVASFYTSLVGGSPKQAKRRRPDVLTFGAPVFYHDNPPPATPVPGSERLPRHIVEAAPYTAAHAMTDRPKSLEDLPRVSLVVFGRGPLAAKQPVIFDQEEITGEVRLQISEPRIVESIKVSFVLSMRSDVENDASIVAHTAVLWSKKLSDPTGTGASQGPSADSEKGQWPLGIYVFPFIFPALPQDVRVVQKEEAERRNKGETRVDLPPNYYTNLLGIFEGQVTYDIRVDVEYGALSLLKLAPIPDFARFELTYLPRTRPLPRELKPFPYLPTREEWPLNREDVGGWNLTPFGGRGRFDGKIVEVEGILGVPSHPVFAPTDQIPYTLILWSTDTTALAALARPSSISAMFCSNEVFAQDALAPRTQSRKARKTVKSADGSVEWVSGGSDPSLVEDDRGVSAPSQQAKPLKRSSLAQSTTSSLTASADDDLVHATSDLTLDSPGAPLSPIDEDGKDISDGEDDVDISYYPGSEGKDNVITLKGVVSPQAARGMPSFNYKYLNRNYMLKVVITHPKYSHISPSALGIYAEAPIWITSDPPASLSSASASVPAPKSTPSPRPEPDFEALRRLPLRGQRTIELRSLSTSSADDSNSDSPSPPSPSPTIYFRSPVRVGSSTTAITGGSSGSAAGNDSGTGVTGSVSSSGHNAVVSGSSLSNMS